MLINGSHGDFLEVVATLLNQQHTEQAHILYRLVLGLDDEARWKTVAPALVSESMIVGPAIEPILGRTETLVGHPSRWGRTACELLGRVVCEQQKSEWSSDLAIRALFAEKSGEPFDANQPFEPQEDDIPTLWYFAPDRLYAPRASASRQRLIVQIRAATELPQAETFDFFADWLLGEIFAVGTGILLASLFDGLTGKLGTRTVAHHRSHAASCVGSSSAPPFAWRPPAAPSAVTSSPRRGRECCYVDGCHPPG